MESIFRKKLDENPGDQVARGIFADYLDDHEHRPLEAELLRWNGALGDDDPDHPEYLRHAAYSLWRALYWLRTVELKGAAAEHQRCLGMLYEALHEELRPVPLASLKSIVNFASISPVKARAYARELVKVEYPGIQGYSYYNHFHYRVTVKTRVIGPNDKGLKRSGRVRIYHSASYRFRNPEVVKGTLFRTH